MSVNETRERILAATTKLLVENGEQATSMSLISKTAHVSIGSIYHLFSGKEALITAAYLDCRSKLLAGSFHISSVDPGSPKDVFRAMQRQYLDSALTHPYEFQLVTQYHLSPIIDRKIFVPSDFQLGDSGRTLSELSKEGMLKALPPTILDLVSFGIINQLVKAHYAGFIELTSEIKETILDVCWDAVRANFPEN